ncbi:transmembrane 4 L6 family member 1-like isoform X2 [Betta splendens]|nr:transmembrane 4 L6 family member 1-like isoform X2 [Betta splendens]
MCVSRCLRCVGVSLVSTAIICSLANILLLFPGLSSRFLLDRHVTSEATWATGVWGSGLLVLLGARSFVQSSKTRGCCAFRSQMLCQVLYSCVSLLGAFICGVVSANGLANGPLCLYNSTHGQTWGVPLKPSPGEWSYLYNRTLWSTVCLEPQNVVQWNMVLFSVMGSVSGLQVLLCVANVLNSLLGMILGHGSGQTKV